MADARPALEQGRGFIGGRRLFLGGRFKGLQRADSFKIDIGKRMEDSFERVVGRSRKRTRRHGLKKGKNDGEEKKGRGYNNQGEVA